MSCCVFWWVFCQWDSLRAIRSVTINPSCCTCFGYSYSFDEIYPVSDESTCKFTLFQMSRCKCCKCKFFSIHMWHKLGLQLWHNWCVYDELWNMWCFLNLCHYLVCLNIWSRCGLSFLAERYIPENEKTCLGKLKKRVRSSRRPLGVCASAYLATFSVFGLVIYHQLCWEHRSIYHVVFYVGSVLLHLSARNTSLIDPDLSNNVDLCASQFDQLFDCNMQMCVFTILWLFAGDPMYRVWERHLEKWKKYCHKISMEGVTIGVLTMFCIGDFCRVEHSYRILCCSIFNMGCAVFFCIGSAVERADVAAAKRRERSR